MFALITEAVASAAALGGGSRRGVGVLLSLRSRGSPGRQAARCSSGLETLYRETTCHSPDNRRGGRTRQRLPAVLKIPAAVSGDEDLSILRRSSESPSINTLHSYGGM